MSDENVIIDGAIEKLKKGFDIVGDTVKTTLGPMGKVVLIDMGDPYITKDGVTVTKSITLKDKEADYGASLLKQTAQKTVEEAGDGTTTSIILTQKMVDEGYRAISAGNKPVHIIKGIEKAVNKAVNEILLTSIPVDSVEDSKKVAIISSNNDEEIGSLIAQALEKVGLHGTIHIALSETDKTYLDVTEGMKFSNGIASSHFFNAGETSKILHNPYVIIYNHDLSVLEPVLEILQKIATESKNQDVLFIANNYSGKVLDNFILNSNGKILNICPVESPAFGESRKNILEDIAVYTSNETGILSTSTKPIVGRAERVVITKNSTVIFGGYGKKENIDNRLIVLKEDLEQTQDPFHRDMLRHRISNLQSSVATIYVGGKTEAEMNEKRDRVEDAVEAVASAVQEGVVVGGGMSYLRIADKLSELNVPHEEMIGVKIVQAALKEPFYQLMRNSNMSLDIESCLKLSIINDINMGIDFSNNTVVNLLEKGIIDSAKVERVALQNAAATAKIFLNISAIVGNDKKGGFL